MPVFEVTSPDGQTFDITVPEGATQEQALAFAKLKFAAKAPTKPVEATSLQPAPSIGEKLYRGAKDPLDASAQLFEKVMPAGFNEANRSANNWLAEKLGVVTPMPAGGVNELIANQEKAYQGRRAAAGETGLDAWRLAGNVVSPMNAVIAAKAPQAASLLGRVGVGAAQGALSGALNPVTEGDFWTEKVKQAGMGTLVGGALPVATGALSRVISPAASTNPEIALLKSEGIKPTLGQTLGGWANAIEEKAQSLPIMGDAIRYNRSKSWDDLNRAATNRALAEVDENLPANVKVGNDAVLYTRKLLGDKYDALVPKLGVQVDQPFATALGSIQSMVNQGAIEPKAADALKRFVDDSIIGKFQGQGAMTGQTFKGVQEAITKKIQALGASTNHDERLMGQALKEIGTEFQDLLIRSNPQYAKELAALNKAWGNFKIVQRGASGVGTDAGVMTPAQLQNAVKAQDFSKDKARFAEGLARMQDLSQAGKRNLGNRIPDSGTSGRNLTATLLGSVGLGAAAPASLAVTGPVLGALGTGALGYLPPVQRLLSGAVSARPQVAQPIADALKKASPYLVPAATETELRLMNDQ
jgi:hypothetical protein